MGFQKSILEDSRIKPTNDGMPLSQEFKISTPKEPKRYIQSLSGGMLMGYSASLGIGCTIGAFFSAIPSFSLSGWLFGISLAIGAYLGTKVIKAIG